MKLLSETEYLATMAEPMKQLSSEAYAPFSFWDYFDAIPLSDYEGRDCSAGAVNHVWEHPNGKIQHVLVDSDSKNVFMVLILDVSSQSVIGHRLLDLNREYGLKTRLK